MNRIQRGIGFAITWLALGLAPMAHAADETPAPPPATPTESAAPAPAHAEATRTSGLAAVYTDRLNGKITASGERYNRNQLTAAHKTLPFGTKVKVTSARTHKSVIVRINDRGPMQPGRVLDLSPAAAKAIGIRPNAMGHVSLSVVGHAPRHAGRHHKAGK
jgi:rare lipoprotein A